MKTIPLALAAVATLFSTVALADATASASFSQLRVQLVDLDPADGITPSVTFQTGSTISMGAYSPDVNGFFDNSWPVPFAQESHDEIEPYSQSSAALTGDAFTAPGALVATSAAAQITHFSQANAEFIFLKDFFTLSAHTELIISGHASNAVGTTSTPKWPLSDQYAFAESYLSTGVANTSSLSNTWDALVNGMNGSSSNEGDLTVSFSNLDGASTLGSIQGYTAVLVTSSIPEPETISLLGLGGLAVAAALRRRGSGSANRSAVPCR